MSNPKNELIKLDLSGHSIVFSSPMEYSADYPGESKTQYHINIYDVDLYKNSSTESKNIYLIRQSYWDYKTGLIFKKILGTLSMTISIKQEFQNSLNIDDGKFLKALRGDLEKIYTKHIREDFNIELPEEYKLQTISSIRWGFYEYFINGKRIVAYAIPISEKHYLRIEFEFINNSEGEENNWKENAQTKINNIMSSFVIE